MQQELLQNVDLTDIHPLDFELIDGIVNSLEVFIQSQDEIITAINVDQEDVKARLESVRGLLERTMNVLNNGNKLIKKLVDKTIIPELPYRDRSMAAGGKKNKTRKRRNKNKLKHK